MLQDKMPLKVTYLNIQALYQKYAKMSLELRNLHLEVRKSVEVRKKA